MGRSAWWARPWRGPGLERSTWNLLLPIESAGTSASCHRRELERAKAKGVLQRLRVLELSMWKHALPLEESLSGYPAAYSQVQVLGPEGQECPVERPVGKPLL